MPARPAAQRPAPFTGQGESCDKPAMDRSREVGEMFDVLDMILQHVDANLRFTKAIYRGTKRSSAWPGVEASIMTRSKTAFDFGFGDEQILLADLAAHMDDRSERAQRTQQTVSRDSSTRNTPSTRDIPCELTPALLQRNTAAHKSIARNTPALDAISASEITCNVRDLDELAQSKKDYPQELTSRSTFENSKRSLSKRSKSAAAGTICRAIVEGMRQGGTPDFSAHGHHATCMEELTRIITEKNDIYQRRLATLWRFLEDKHSSRAAYAYYFSNNVFLMLAILVALGEVLDMSLFSSKHRSWGTLGNGFQMTIELVFAIELILRFFACRNRLYFFHNVYNFLDLCSISPLVFRAIILTVNHHALDESQSVSLIAFLGIVPVLRLLRLLRYFGTFKLLLYAFQSLLLALPMLMFVLVLIVLTFGAVIYYCEPRSSIPSLPLSFYFAIVSLSTVGYGDLVPETDAGRIWTTILIIIGPMYMAIPIGIIGNSFSEVWVNRQRLLLLHRMRDCVHLAGYSRDDLHRLFALLDADGSGVLDYDEFVALVEIMNIHVKKETVAELFQSFDAGDDGTIDFQELLFGLFDSS